MMQVHSKTRLQEEAQLLFQSMEKDFKPCEVIYIIGELQKILSLVMLNQQEA